jgi:hypothetical protein
MRYHVIKAKTSETAEQLEARIKAEANRDWRLDFIVRDDDGSHLIMVFSKTS